MQYKDVFGYLRISQDDDDKTDESNSIKNQKLLIEQFIISCEEFQGAKVHFYIDDGYSGTNFERPDFKKMMQIVKGRNGCCIIVKDLSRLGRDTIDTQDYIEKIFPFLQIRFIAINDYYDSADSLSSRKDTEVKFKNLVNGIYPQICSENIKKVMYQLGEQGKYNGAIPPYGYMFNGNDKTSLLLDREVSWVVRLVIDKRLEGESYSGIARMLNERGLQDVYKRQEPLIEKHMFEVIQHLMNKDMRKSRNGLALLSGLVECGDCHQSMIRKSPNSTNYYYVCSTSLYEKKCKSHSISEKNLIEAVKQNVHYYISIIVELETILGYVETSSFPKQKIYEADQQMKCLEMECERFMQIKVNLYNSYCEGLLDEEEFSAYKKKYDDSLKQVEEAVKRQKIEIADMQKALERHQEWMKYFLVYKDMEEIDRATLALLVKRIKVHSDRQITIEFWFEDEFERLLSLLATVNTVQPDLKLNEFLHRREMIISA